MSDAMASEMRIQLTSTIIFFAPSERDVYSYERTPKYLAALGAKPSRRTFAGEAKAIALLRSLGLKANRQAINISPLRGEAINNVLALPT
jgi:hypothetical protein